MTQATHFLNIELMFSSRHFAFSTSSPSSAAWMSSGSDEAGTQADTGFALVAFAMTCLKYGLSRLRTGRSFQTGTFGGWNVPVSGSYCHHWWPARKSRFCVQVRNSGSIA